MGDADVDALLEAPFKEEEEAKPEVRSEEGPKMPPPSEGSENGKADGKADGKEDGGSRNGDEKEKKPAKKSRKRSRSRSKDRKERKRKSRSRSRTPKKKSKKRDRSRSGSPRSKSKSSKKSKRSRSRSKSPLRGGWPASRWQGQQSGGGGGGWGGGGGGGWGGGGGGGGWGGGGGGGWGGGSRGRSPPRWGGGGRSPPRGRLPGPERRDVMPFSPRKSPPRDAKEEMSTEERDARTIFIMQIAARTKPRDLEEFFSSVGRVRDVRIITDSKTRRSKGIAYIEFWELEAVPLAIGLNGQRLLGAPLIIQASQADKNRMANATSVGGVPGFGFETQTKGPMKLYVGSLHTNITEDMLKGIFEPFGRIDRIELMKEPETGESRGYGFVTYGQVEDAKRAMEQLNGFELAGRPIKVGNVTDHMPAAAPQIFGRSLDNEELDRTGVDLGTAGRLSLMAKLAEGTGLQLPNQAQQVLNLNQTHGLPGHPPIATQCFMLTNMFDPSNETEQGWEADIQDDVIEECSKNGGVLHIFVDRASSTGNVYVKCPSVTSAVAAVNSLHGRWFAGKIITANYVPVNNYHQLFPDALRNQQPLRPNYKR